MESRQRNRQRLSVSTLLTHEIHAPKPPVSIAGDFLAKARALKEEDAASTPRARAAAPRSPARAVGTASNSSQAQSMNARRFAEGYAQQQRNPPVEVERKKRENLSSMLKSIADQHAATPVRRVRERRQEGQQPEARKVDSSAFLAQTPRNPPVEDERKNRENLSSMLKEIADQHAATPVRRVRERRQEGQQSEARVGQQPEAPKVDSKTFLAEHRTIMHRREEEKEQQDRLLQFKLMWWMFARYARRMEMLRVQARWNTWRGYLYSQKKLLLLRSFVRGRVMQRCRFFFARWIFIAEISLDSRQREVKLHSEYIDLVKSQTQQHEAALSESMSMLDGLKVEHEKAREETDAEHQKQVDALKADHATLKADHAALKADHDALKAKKDAEHQKQVDALKADHATLKAAHAALKADHDALKDEHDALKGEHELDTLEAALEMKLKSLVAICDKTRGGISALHRSFLRWRTLASLTKLVPPLPPRSNASPTKLREKHAQELDDIKAKNDAAQMAMRLKQLVVVAGQQGCRAMLKLFWRWHNEASKAARKGLHRAAGRRPGFRGVVQASQSEAGALAQALMDIIVATTATHKQELEILQSTTATHKQELEILQSSSAKAHLSKCLKQLVLVSEHFQSIEVLRLFWKWRGVIYTTKHVEQHWDEADAHLTALLTETSAEKEQIREELTKVNAAAEAQYKQELEMYHFTNDQAKMTKCLKLLTFVSEHGGRQAVLRLFWIWHGKTLTAKHVDYHLSEADEEAQALIAKNAAEQEAMREELMQINAAAEVEHKQEVEKLQASRAEAHLSKCLKQIVLLSEHRGRQAVLRLFWRWHGNILTAKHVDHHLNKADEEAQALIAKNAAEQKAMRERLTKIHTAAEAEHKQEVEKLRSSAAEQEAKREELTQIYAAAEAANQQELNRLQSSSAQAHLSKSLKQLVIVAEQQGRQIVQRQFWRWHGVVSTVRNVLHHQFKVGADAKKNSIGRAAIFLQLNFADLQGKLLLVQLGFWRWYCRAIQRTRAFLSAPIVPGESQALEQDQPFCFLPFVSPPPSSSQESAKDREVMEALMNANAALEERYREGTKELTAAHTELRIENSLRRVFTMRLEQIRRALHLKFSRWCTITSFAVASQGQQPLPPPVSTQQTTQRSKAQIEQGKVAADAAAAEEAMGPPKRRPLASPSRRASTPRAR